jgi:hypothetical protein
MMNKTCSMCRQQSRPVLQSFRNYNEDPLTSCEEESEPSSSASEHVTSCEEDPLTSCEDEGESDDEDSFKDDEDSFKDDEAVDAIGDIKGLRTAINAILDSAELRIAAGGSAEDVQQFVQTNVDKSMVAWSDGTLASSMAMDFAGKRKQPLVSKEELVDESLQNVQMMKGTVNVGNPFGRESVQHIDDLLNLARDHPTDVVKRKLVGLSTEALSQITEAMTQQNYPNTIRHLAKFLFEADGNQMAQTEKLIKNVKATQLAVVEHIMLVQYGGRDDGKIQHTAFRNNVTEAIVAVAQGAMRD